MQREHFPLGEIPHEPLYVIFCDRVLIESVFDYSLLPRVRIHDPKLGEMIFFIVETYKASEFLTYTIVEICEKNQDLVLNLG